MLNIDTKRKANFGVTLTPCTFKEHTYIARVPRKTVTTDQLLDLVVAHNQGIDRYQVGHSMELLKKEIIEQASLGFAVDVMEICKLYIAPSSSVRSLTPEAETVTGFEARFAVNAKLKASLADMSAAVTAVVESAPQISQIENPAVKETTQDAATATLKATFSARIRGRKLKLGGAESGVYFVPEADGEPSDDESAWIKVADEFITKNTPTTLEFHLPRTLEKGKRYFIAVRTSISGNTALKAPVTGMSKVAIAVEE